VSPDRPPAEFSSEAVETAEALGRNLLLLEKCAADPDPEVLNSVFRQAHSLKGLAATFGQQRLAELAHAAEDLLDRFRLGKARLTPARLDLLLEAVELFQRLAEEPGSAEDEAGMLAARLSAMDEGPERLGEDPLERLELAPEMRRVLTEFEEHRLRETLRRGDLVWTARVEYPLETFDRELEQLKARLRGLGELVSTLPGPAGDRLDVLSFVLLVGSGAGESGLRGAFGGVPVELRPVPVRKERRPGPEGEGRRRADGAAPGGVARTLRVDIARLDALMDDVGELRLIGEAFRGCRTRASCRRGRGRWSCSASTAGWCAGWTSSRTGCSRRGWCRSARCSTACSAWSGGWRARPGRRWCSRPPVRRCRSTSAWWRS
jgi:two-component system chemotaxis sensor kinase CheA